MRRWLTAQGLTGLGLTPLMAALVVATTSVVPSASARPMDAPLQRQLLALYQRYNQTVAAGKLDDALALRSTAVRQALTSQLQTPKERADYLATASQMVADRLDLRHASENDGADKALLIALAETATPSRQAQNELDISFVKEGGVWKVGDLAVGPGPADIKRCGDTGYEPLSAYDISHSISVVGRIERVDFAPDHTLVVVLAGASEVCSFLPDRTVLRQHEMDPATLQPYRVADITGVTNRHDPQKVMVNNITVHAEE